ncbi:N-terminal phage integrase SAM-like domain-containing protein [Streptomyces odontomachi]|uniref:N-terminal phage integrase SAM-like domain-containing protein n=1 Tax=Streptomyces odontomachi TaxID=2944940 RepID=UPI0027E39991|nr:N-terminal phage integrase SAM-like domain-containing protein [Streptomyces sp. ODS25]
MSGKRSNGEGSIYAYRNGYAAYAWVTTPDGNRKRKYVYGPTRKDVHEKWLKLHAEAKKGPVATNTPTLAQYLTYWLKEVVEPNLRPLTAATYETTVRLYIVPFLGTKRLDRLTVQDMRSWLNKLAETCQCCAQGKDAKRPEERQRCCAKGGVLRANPLQALGQRRPDHPAERADQRHRGRTHLQERRPAGQGATGPA